MNSAFAAAFENEELLPATLAQELRSREPAALAAFYDVWFDKLYGYVARLVEDEHAAEDLTQDVFLQIHRALPTYDPARRLAPWVYTIATNRVRDHWRGRGSRGRSRESLSIDEVLEAPATDRPAEAALEEAEEAQEVRRSIEELPASMKSVLLLRVDHGLPFEAIAGILALSVPAARKRYSRALQALRGTLEGAAARWSVEDSVAS